jgi:hypothetical protein
MAKKLVLFLTVSVFSAALWISSLEVVSAEDQCDTPSFQEALEQNSQKMIVEGFKFLVPTEVTVSVDRCLYYEEEAFNLVTANVVWIGPLEGLTYDTTVYFIPNDEFWDYRLLGANDNARDYMMSVRTWFPSLTGVGRFDGEFEGPSRGPFR